MELSDEEHLSLTSGGDCPLHYHNYDKSITHDQVLQLQDSEKERVITSSEGISYEDDFLFVDTTSGPVTVSLPIARGGKSYTFSRIAGASNITLSPLSPDTINGSASLVISSSFSPVRIKSMKGMGWLQV